MSVDTSRERIAALVAELRALCPCSGSDERIVGVVELLMAADLLEALRAERDEARDEWAKYMAAWQGEESQRDAAEARAARLREILEDMTRQFAFWSDMARGLTTGGLSVLEDAFEALGWSDPHPLPEFKCDEPGCQGGATCGWPSAAGYRRTCGKHMLAAPDEGGRDA